MIVYKAFKIFLQKKYFFLQAHEAGLATLQVASEGLVISNSVIFEYKLPPKEEQTITQEANTERPNDNLLKFTLLQRLEAMDNRLQIKQEPDNSDGVCINLNNLQNLNPTAITLSKFLLGRRHYALSTK